jgi:hypothetical protein
MAPARDVDQVPTHIRMGLNSGEAVVRSIGSEASNAHRRRFLATLVGFATAGPIGGPTAHASRLRVIGIQLYTVRDLLQRDFEGTLARLAAIGYREVEFAGYFGRSAQAVRAALQTAGLDAPSVHVPIEAARTDWPRALEAAHVAEHKYLVVAWLPEHDRASLDRYRAVADLFSRVGEQARAAGLRFAYHNHDFEFARLEGRLPYDVLLERCDPRYVAFEMDLYWITKGRQDPLDYFARWPSRVPIDQREGFGGPAGAPDGRRRSRDHSMAGDLRPPEAGGNPTLFRRARRARTPARQRSSELRVSPPA